MKQEMLLEIALEVRDIVRAYIRENEDYGEVLTRRKRDITRRVDMAAEQALDGALASRGIGAHVISEELGERDVGTPDCTLVFDPIDGSTNATCGIPFFCTSLACSNKTGRVNLTDIEMGAVCSIQGDMYHAVAGSGAFRNGKPLGQKRGTRTKPVVAVYSYGVPDVPEGLIELEKTIIVRTLGSIALDMCFAADGTLDGVIDTRDMLSAYDIAASALILRESGGILTDLSGTPLDGDAKATALRLIGTKNRELHNKIVSYIGGAGEHESSSV